MFQALGSYEPDQATALANGLAFWLLAMPIDWPAIYLPGLAAAAVALTRRRLPRGATLDTALLLSLAVAGLLVAFVFRSVIGNNDLGWRSIIASFMVLGIFTAAGLTTWFQARTLVVLTALLVGLGLHGTSRQADALVAGISSPTAQELARAPALWEAVRRHSGPDDRVVNNPLYLQETTKWPTNITWALLSDRRSCYAVWEMVLVFSPLVDDQAWEVAQIYNRVFAGRPAPDDLTRMSTRYGCDVAVVVPSDGAWTSDPFADSALYRPVEVTTQWRIYRRAG